jgi:hypothetical protein
MNERHDQPPTDSGEGLPEDGQPGTGVDPREHPENEAAGTGASDAGDAKDGDAGQATGNPRAAGADS